MGDSEVIVLSLAVGFGIGVALLMVLWACRACLGKPKTADDDHAATNAVRRQPAVPGTAEVAEQKVSIQLPARPEQVRHSLSMQTGMSISVIERRLLSLCSSP
jgi:hypothetical protein